MNHCAKYIQCELNNQDKFYTYHEFEDKIQIGEQVICQVGPEIPQEQSADRRFKIKMKPWNTIVFHDLEFCGLIRGRL